LRMVRGLVQNRRGDAGKRSASEMALCETSFSPRTV
jgi:hypothetical protein